MRNLNRAINDVSDNEQTALLSTLRSLEVTLNSQSKDTHSILTQFAGEIKSLSQAITLQSHAIEKAVSNVMEKHSGIVPLDMMRISEHKAILDNTIANNSSQIASIQDSNAKTIRHLLWAFGLMFVALIGARVATRLIPADMGHDAVNQRISIVP